MTELGPLAPLVGTWEGDQGLDVSYHHADGEVGETEYFERVTFSSFGPVENGRQTLYGLDYRTAAWRKGEEHLDPFHTEVGYWLWDAAAGQVMRAFMVPRGAVLIAGGDATMDATELVMRAELGSATYGVLSNRYLDENARTVLYEVTIRFDGTDTWSYEEDTVLEMSVLDGQLHHTDRNTLHRVS